MKHPVIILAAALAVGSAAVARPRVGRPRAPQRHRAPASSTRHADITGEGISGTADFTESQQATGKLVTITLTVRA
jgi:hypothetical protein